jgi:Fe-S cluster biogenesis protein NfuA
MFIQTETTPNPATLKFLPGRTVMETGTVHYTRREDAVTSPLAQALFAVKGIEGVFFGGDFVTITKAEDEDWSVLKPPVLGAIMEHFISGRSLFDDAGGAVAALDETYAEEDAHLVEQIKELLDTRVRPAVAQDGGDIVFRGFEDGIVFLHMQGSCSGCPSSTATLKMGIENMLKHYVPEVVEVRAVV